VAHTSVHISESTTTTHVYVYLRFVLPEVRACTLFYIFTSYDMIW